MKLLDSSMPVRRLRPSKRGITGRVALPSGRSAGHESSLERDLLLMLAFDRRVSRLLEQPFRLTYELDGKGHRYTPDVQADFAHEGREWSVVYEVKYRADLAANWQHYRPRFKAAVRHCRANSLRFKIVTEHEIRGPQIDNIRFLRRYRDLPAQEVHRVALLQNILITGPTTPKTLLAATWYDQERRMAALCELWRLVAVGEIAADLALPLTMSSPIWGA